MINLNEKTQALAVKKVLNEMESAKQNVEKWDASWTEQCLEAQSSTLRNISRDEVLDMETKYSDYYKLTNVFHPETRIGVPLRTESLKDCKGKLHLCEFGKINWYGMKSHYSTRYFSFNNDGTIQFSKGIIPEKLLKRKSRVSYDASYNVLTDEFYIGIIQDRINKDENDSYNYFVVSIEYDILSQKYNGVEVRVNLCTNEKELIVDENYKDSPFALLPIPEIEKRIMRMVKCIKGEIPLPGLVERIDNYLALMEEELTPKEEHGPLLELA